MSFLRRIAMFVQKHARLFWIILVGAVILSGVKVVWVLPRLYEQEGIEATLNIGLIWMGAAILGGAVLLLIVASFAQRRLGQHFGPSDLAYLKQCFSKGISHLDLSVLVMCSRDDLPGSLEGLNQTYTIVWIGTAGMTAGPNRNLHIPSGAQVAAEWSKETPLAVFFDEYAYLWAILLGDGTTAPLDNLKKDDGRSITCEVNFRGAFVAYPW